MENYKDLFNKEKLAAVRRLKHKHFTTVTREELDQAMSEYLKRGGKIKRVETEWIEEGEIRIDR